MKHMPDGEIAMFYRQAKDKPYQVVILADLCLVPVETMVKKLTELGFKDVVAAQRDKLSDNDDDIVFIPWSDDDIAFLKDEYERDVPTWEIAQALGRSQKAVATKASKMGFVRPKRKKNKAQEFEWRSLLNVHLL